MQHVHADRQTAIDCLRRLEPMAKDGEAVAGVVRYQWGSR